MENNPLTLTLSMPLKAPVTPLHMLSTLTQLTAFLLARIHGNLLGNQESVELRP